MLHFPGSVGTGRSRTKSRVVLEARSPGLFLTLAKTGDHTQVPQPENRMPLNYVVYREHCLVVIIGLGRVTWEEIRERQEQIKIDPTSTQSSTRSWIYGQSRASICRVSMPGCWRAACSSLSHPNALLLPPARPFSAWRERGKSSLSARIIRRKSGYLTIFLLP